VPTPELLAFAKSLCRGAGIPDAPPCLLDAICGLPRHNRRAFLDELGEGQRRSLRARTPAGVLGLMIEDMADEERRGLFRERAHRKAETEM
jgi:hypothetical protein